jgi:hypothetical protein
MMAEPEREPIAIDRDTRNLRSHVIVEFEQAMAAFGTLSPKVSWLAAARRFTHAASIMDRMGLRTVAIAIILAGTPLPSERSLIKYREPRP